MKEVNQGDAKKVDAKHVSKQTGQQKTIDEIAKEFEKLNHRQLELVNYFRACPSERTNMTAMKKLYGISAITAMKDLKTMEGYGLLMHRKKGRHVFYYPTQKLLFNKSKS